MSISPTEWLKAWVALPDEGRKRVLLSLGNGVEGVRCGAVVHFRRRYVIGDLLCGIPLQEPFEILDLALDIMRRRPVIQPGEFEDLLRNGQICEGCFTSDMLNRRLTEALG